MQEKHLNSIYLFWARLQTHRRAPAVHTVCTLPTFGILNVPSTNALVPALQGSFNGQGFPARWFIPPLPPLLLNFTFYFLRFFSFFFFFSFSLSLSLSWLDLWAEKK